MSLHGGSISNVGQLDKLRAGWQPALKRVINPPQDDILPHSQTSDTRERTTAHGNCKTALLRLAARFHDFQQDRDQRQQDD